MIVVSGCATLRTGLAPANGKSLYYSCGGSGQSVVFLAGLGGDHSLWPIAERVRAKAYACTYDRVGDGQSSRPEDKTTVSDDAGDLHELVGQAGLTRPVVLVGHSYGGLLAYYMALTHPEDVAGVVLIDGSHPRQEEEFRALLSEDQWAQLQADDANRPYADFSGSLAEALQVYGPLGDMPLTVLTATSGFSGDDCATMPCAEMQASWLVLQKEYAALNSNSRHVELATGHYIHDDEPDVVVEEILALLERVSSATD